MFTIFYALVGICAFATASGLVAVFAQAPLNRFLSTISMLMGITKTSSSWKAKVAKLALVFAAQFTFMFVMAGIYMAVEEWTFSDALYFTFISVTTIGMCLLNPLS
jgi:hypothetical protein